MTDCTSLSASTESNRTHHGGVKRHYHTHVGTNGRFDSLQAAVILGKWAGFEDEVNARGDIGARYSELLKGHTTCPVRIPMGTAYPGVFPGGSCKRCVLDLTTGDG